MTVSFFEYADPFGASPGQEVQDDAGKTCCASEIENFILRVQSAVNPINVWSHAFLKLPFELEIRGKSTDTIGFHPGGGGLDQLSSDPGKIKDNTDEQYSCSTLYSACPETVDAVKAEINRTLENIKAGAEPFAWDNIGGRNCAGMACRWLNAGNITTEYRYDTPNLIPGFNTLIYIPTPFSSLLFFTEGGDSKIRELYKHSLCKEFFRMLF